MDIAKELAGLNVDSIGAVEHYDDSIEVYYPGADVDTRLDRRIERLLKKHGYARIGSGVDLEDGMRDLRFEKA